jgi:predicted helicase
MRVDTDPSIVRKFLADPHSGVRVVFSTYQSARVVAEGSRESAAFDIGIFDEAHKTTGPSGGMFAFALRDSDLAIRKRVFFTATPRVHLQTRDREGDFKLVSMDDPAAYGPVVHELSFADAFKAGIICDYRVILSLVDPAEVTASAIQHGITLVERDLQATAWVATQIAVQRAIQLCGRLDSREKTAMHATYGPPTVVGAGDA